MSFNRTNRISEEIKKNLSRIIKTEVKDPRINEMCTITGVDVTRDLRYAKVYVSIFGTDEDKQTTIVGLRNASSFIRRELGKNLDIRYIPELQFILDNSIEYSIRISKKLDEINRGQGDD